MGEAEVTWGAEEVMNILRHYRFRSTTERLLQDAIERLLQDHGVPFTRELELSPKDRPDFFVTPGLCIEVKIGGSASDARRQLERYAAHGVVEELLLVTTRMIHVMPAAINGKPARVLHIGGAFS